ncbi:MAG: ATP-binding protein [Deltaproteobacteria bacterium]|nr:ATP-binding protein [Deltaproteobacteria bacterium]
METLSRILHLDLPPGQSAFLWGPRKTGKSTFLKERFPQSLVYDFLKTDLYFEFTKRPSLLREQLLARGKEKLRTPIILDEVQKIPEILNEVHWLIENRGHSFILCGSSARKLKRGKANLLGGRAWRFEMFPLVSAEVKDLDLLRALNHGLIPAHYLQDRYEKSLKAYTQDYLKEEVFAEGLIRNIPAFSRFFEAMGFSHGEMINYTNIARECGVDAKTVREYFQILVDTLLGRRLAPYKKRQDRQVISHTPKFYLFDVGVAGALSRRRIVEARGELFGKALEHFIFMELSAYSAYRDLNFDLNYWRTKTGLEVDFILGGGEVALEVKGSSRVDPRALRPLLAFTEEHRPRFSLMVTNEADERVVGPIRLLPWKTFLERLWAGTIIH